MIDLVELRRAAGMTQMQLADALATTQGQVSRLERQSDMLLSTLSAYLTALGVQARLVVLVDGTTITQEITEARQR
ncbi:MAG TPA: helix-turn-helix transcriptional regulator [Mycobacterium sp.]|nr:helix-turn-helix transcriptional regulator [Mycobacterium sp.]